VRLGVVVIAIVAVLASLVWYQFFRDDAPVSASLAEAASAVQASGSARIDDIAGQWSTANGGKSFLGYRVGEELAGIGTTTAVGRTANVQSTVVIAETEVTSATIVGDLTMLTSDSSMRDQALRQQALQTSTFRTAQFELTTPIVLGDELEKDAAVDLFAQGNLTIHGVTQAVSFPLQAQVSGSYLLIVGSMDTQFADYNIAAPSSPRVLALDDHGTIEVQLVLSQS
jgi:polyisoprenoid-binding protein YceI